MNPPVKGVTRLLFQPSVLRVGNSQFTVRPTCLITVQSSPHVRLSPLLNSPAVPAQPPSPKKGMIILIGTASRSDASVNPGPRVIKYDRTSVGHCVHDPRVGRSLTSSLPQSSKYYLNTNHGLHLSHNAVASEVG